MQGRVLRPIASIWLGLNLCIFQLFLREIIVSMLDHVTPANKQVKGLLKGLRYISQIFDGEKEQEMVIGLPTDVKHVAHIGWDGPTSSNSPSWMNDFHSAPLSSPSFDPHGKQPGSPKSVSQEIPLGGVGLPPQSPSRDDITSSSSPKPRRTRRQGSSEPTGSDSATRESREHSSRGTRHSRKNLSTGSAPGSDPPTHEESESSSRRGRRAHKSDNAIGSSESESPARDLPSIPKQSRKKEKDKDKEGKEEKEEGKKEEKKERKKEKVEGKKEEKKEGKKERKSKGSSSDGGSTRSKSKNPPSSSGLLGSEETNARTATVAE